MPTPWAAILECIIRVDLLHAQRHLSDNEQRGRDEDLSKTLGRFYERNLEKRSPDPVALKALADSEQQLNEHFAQVFKPTLERLNKLGYPGLANPELMIKSELRGESLLSSSAHVHYSVPGGPVDSADGSAITLPDRYNGLGFKNLIYMVVEILAAYRSWLDLAGLLVRTARGRHLRLDTDWPWARDLTAAFHRLRAAPWPAT